MDHAVLGTRTFLRFLHPFETIWSRRRCLHDKQQRVRDGFAHPGHVGLNQLTTKCVAEGEAKDCPAVCRHLYGRPRTRRRGSSDLAHIDTEWGAPQKDGGLAQIAVKRSCLIVDFRQRARGASATK